MKASRKNRVSVVLALAVAATLAGCVAAPPPTPAPQARHPAYLHALTDLRAAQVDVLTLGQYLRPTPNHLNVERFVAPQQFDDYREWALQLGFLECVSGPLVRSSYRAEQALARNNAGLDNAKLAVKALGA